MATKARSASTRPARPTSKTTRSTASAKKGASTATKKSVSRRKPAVRSTSQKRAAQTKPFTISHRHLIGSMMAVAILAVGMIGYMTVSSSYAATVTAVGSIKGLGGKCLDNKSARVANGNKIQMYSCNNTVAQKWSLYSDQSIRVQGYCLDVKSASKSVGATVQLYRCNGTAAQKWTVNKSNGTIVNPNSKNCLDVRYASKSNGALAWMYRCNGTAAQKWTVATSASISPSPNPSPSPSPAPAPTPTPTPGSGKLIWSDEFNGTSVDKSKWTVVNQLRSTESHHQGRYLTANTAIGDGNLKIVTKRHCVRSGTLPSSSNESTAPCPSGTSTRYSSGQVRTPYIWKSGKMEIRAKMSKTTQNGLWSGFWLRQQGTWCTSEYGELDILEWYSDPKSTSRSTATTHLGCANNKLTSRQHLATVNGSLADDWHTWGVKWDSNSVTYYLDGKVVRSITSHRPNDSNQDVDHPEDFNGMSASRFKSIVDRPWHLRINTQVYPVNDQWHLAPDNRVNFSPQTMLVDYVRVYSL